VAAPGKRQGNAAGAAAAAAAAAAGGSGNVSDAEDLKLRLRIEQLRNATATTELLRALIDRCATDPSMALLLDAPLTAVLKDMTRSK
jgi:hypothetical protein